MPLSCRRLKRTMLWTALQRDETLLLIYIAARFRNHLHLRTTFTLVTNVIYFEKGAQSSKSLNHKRCMVVITGVDPGTLEEKATITTHSGQSSSSSPTRKLRVKFHHQRSFANLLQQPPTIQPTFLQQPSTLSLYQRLCQCPALLADPKERDCFVNRISHFQPIQSPHLIPIHTTATQ